jgi:hypothetical protein
VPVKVMTVSVPPHAAVQVPAVAVATMLPTQAARFISSTLKIAMGELGRTTPGRKWVETQPEATRMVATSKPRGPAVTTMALTMQMPSLTSTGLSGALAMTPAAGQGDGKQAGAAMTPVAGLRLASAR